MSPKPGDRYLLVLGTVCLSIFVTVFGSATGFLLPNAQLPSDSLGAEVALPLLLVAAFSVVAAYICAREPHELRAGAIGGAINMTATCAVFLLVIGLFDRHFTAIGGRGLILYLPLASLIGAVLGGLAGLLRVVAIRPR